jgi:hypothetical protein
MLIVASDALLRDTALMQRLVLAFAVTAHLGIPAAVYAQTAAVNDPAREAELQHWIKAFTEWQEWWAKWANRPEPGMLTSSRPRRTKPAPPEWLASECAEVFDPADRLEAACELLEQWREDNLTARTRALTGTVSQNTETAPKTKWWEHLHVDLLWPATEVRNSVYGVIGMHTAMTVKGRVQLFLAPGVMLLNLPAIDGSRVWKVAANYGIGYRLFDFTFPGDRRASLHVNIAKSYLLLEPRDAVVSRSVDFAGFSISFKRR